MPSDENLSEFPQRKLTTILAADVVGYSRMMNVNEDATHELLGKFLKIIDKKVTHYGGRIFNSAGDSIMAEFSSTVEAVRCAIVIQEEIVALNTNKPASEQMWFRLGLNVGDVIIEGKNLIGDGVNIASRMESIAIPGGICISGSVYELVHNKLSYAFEDMGKQSVKNIREPVSAYSLLPAATPKINYNMASRLQPEINKKSVIKFKYFLSVLFLVTVAIVIAYFSVNHLDDLNTPTQINNTPSVKSASQLKLVEEPDNDQASGIVSESGLPREKVLVTRGIITPSYFVDRIIEGEKRKTGERFVIEMTSHGSAVVTIFKEDEPSTRSGTDSGRWWIDKHERLCFEFKRFSKGRKFCRIYSYEKGSEFLVSGDPSKPKWILQPK